MKGKKITGAAILLFAGLALALYFLKKDPLREVHACLLYTSDAADE